MPRNCDNTSVGVLIRDGQRWLVFDHTTGLPGVAPVSGHMDSHPSPDHAAAGEAHEETGLTLVNVRPVASGWRRNTCRRPPGPHGPGHTWWVFTAKPSGLLRPSPRETRNMRWVTRDELQALAWRTVLYARGETTGAEWAASPGLAPVWLQWLSQALLAFADVGDYQLVDDLAARPMPTGMIPEVPADA
jgi:8-oxo-dGTP pyrophosphatase MutT (NUDIX family)